MNNDFSFNNSTEWLMPVVCKQYVVYSVSLAWHVFSHTSSVVSLPNIIWPCSSLVTHEWALSSHSPPLLFCSALSSFALGLLPCLVPCPSAVSCVMSRFVSCFFCCCCCCQFFFFFLWNLHCSRPNYNIDVADRLADEHVLIGLYVNLLQNNPKTWLVGVLPCLPNTSRNYALCWIAT